MKKNGFTLVELLAVIVILAIILVIAVPKIVSIIEDSKKATLVSTAKMIASAAEKAKVQNQVLGKDVEITCDSVAKLNSLDYERCHIEFDSNNKAHVDIKGSGKFEDMYICKGTKESSSVVDECPNEKVLVELDLNTEEEFNDISGIYKEGTVLYLDTPTKENYKFLGWNVTKGDSKLDDENKLIVGEFDTKIEAEWELNVFSFSVEPNGGIITQEFKTEYAVGETIELETPTRKCYAFTGWTVSGNGSSVTDTSVTMGTEATILTANWKEQYLYDTGDECSAISGGWQTRGLERREEGSYYGADLKLNKKSEYMEIRHDMGWYGCGIVDLVKDLDLTNINKLTLDYSINDTKSIIIHFAIIKRNASYIENWTKAVTLTGTQGYEVEHVNVPRTTKTLDVSGITGSYDIIISMVTAWQGTTSGSLNMYSLKME